MNQSKKAISCAAIVAVIIAGIAYCRALPAANEETPFNYLCIIFISTAVCICSNCAYSVCLWYLLFYDRLERNKI